MTIALDAMGGDFGVPVVVPSALLALKKYSNLHIILVGDEKRIKRFLRKKSADLLSRLTVHHTTEIVGMDEQPSSALRNKKDSSMRVAINLVKEGTAQACVSAGNTGALMATARFVLKTLPGIDRPAIIISLPTLDPNRCVRLLDIGANVDSSVEHLYQFAVMGSVLVSALDESHQTATVGLLNVGEEDIKGNEQVKQAAQLLSESNELNYIGYVEGDDIYKGVCDIVVCDGFVGNIVVKACEGLAKLMVRYLTLSFNKNIFTKTVGFLAMPILRRVRAQIDPAKYNGATFLGLTGIVIKSHGGARIKSFYNAIEEAIHEVEQDVPQLISKQVSEVLQENT